MIGDFGGIGKVSLQWQRRIFYGDYTQAGVITITKNIGDGNGNY